MNSSPLPASASQGIGLSVHSTAVCRGTCRSFLCIWLALAVAVIPHSTLSAPTGSDEWSPASETAVLYNSAQPASKALAEHYAELRGISTDRLVGLKCSADEVISRDEFENTIREPLLRKFIESGWWALEKRDMLDPNGKRYSQVPQVIRQSVRVLAIIRGVPLSVRRMASQNASPQEADEASVDSELAGLGLLNRKIQGAIENRYYQSVNHFPAHASAMGQLLVGRLDAADDNTVRRMMHDALKAEREGLWGRAVVDFGIMDAGYEEGERWLGRCVGAYRENGIPVYTDRYKPVLPEGWPMPDTILYFGWYTDKCKGALATPGFKFKTGAIACHLHSLSAETIRNPRANWCAPILERGAAATFGNVWEPYLTLTVHFDLLNARLLEGFTLAEAAWIATPGLSWMNVVLGDPLYRPFAKPRVMMSEDRADLDYALYHDIAVRYLLQDRKKFCREILRIAEKNDSPRLLELAALIDAVESRHGQASDFFQHAAAKYTKPEDKLRCALYDAELSRRTGDAKGSLDLINRIAGESSFSGVPAMSAVRGLQRELAAK
ncbi:MAG: TIGR03790 family protein [Roseimicrobium sp.]